MNENNKTWAIIVLLGLIFTVIVFKAGMKVGSHRSGHPSFRAGSHQMGRGFDKMMAQKKAAFEARDFTSEGELPGDEGPNRF